MQHGNDTRVDTMGNSNDSPTASRNRPVSIPRPQIPVDFSRDDEGIKYGTLGIPLQLRREPTEADFADPRFDVIWELIKRVDVDFRDGVFSGATGNDVCAVLDALDAAVSPVARETQADGSVSLVSDGENT